MYMAISLLDLGSIAFRQSEVKHYFDSVLEQGFSVLNGQEIHVSIIQFIHRNIRAANISCTAIMVIQYRTQYKTRLFEQDLL